MTEAFLAPKVDVCSLVAISKRIKLTRLVSKKILRQSSNRRVQHSFDGMRDARHFEVGMRGKNVLSGSGCVHFSWLEAR